MTQPKSKAEAATRSASWKRGSPKARTRSALASSKSPTARYQTRPHHCNVADALRRNDRGYRDCDANVIRIRFVASLPVFTRARNVICTQPGAYRCPCGFELRLTIFEPVAVSVRSRLAADGTAPRPLGECARPLPFMIRRQATPDHGEVVGVAPACDHRAAEHEGFVVRHVTMRNTLTFYRRLRRAIPRPADELRDWSRRLV